MKQKVFKLENSPKAYILSLHIRNLQNKNGIRSVKQTINCFLKDPKKLSYRNDFWLRPDMLSEVIKNWFTYFGYNYMREFYETFYKEKL